MKKPFKAFKRTCLTPSGLLLVWMLHASIISGCGSFSHLTGVVEEFPQATECGHCHVEIFKEWSESLHAKAYTNMRFRKATDGYRFTSCLGCHTPELMLTNYPPSARKLYRTEGVNCISCHLEEGKLLGPLDPTGVVSPHLVGVSSDQYRNSRFCGRCHEGTFAEWSAVGMRNKQSCQQCHMPPRRRKMTQPTGTFSRLFTAFEEDAMQKRHTFAIVPEELEITPYSLKVTHYAETVTLTVMNHLPHSLPSGDFGVRIISLQISIVDSQGEVILVGERELVKELGTAVPPQSLLEWKYTISADTRSICVRMIRIGHEGIESKVLIEREIPLL